ncbi:MAG: hypothetical protein E6J07_07290, partial [Chloroflexi bacterium]
MRFPVLRTVIVVVGAAAVLAIPITLVLGHVPVTSTSLTRPLAAESSRDFDDHQVQLASRVPKPTAAPAATAVGAAATASTTAPSHAASPAPVRATVPAFSHIFEIVMENHEYGSVIGRPDAPYVNKLAATYGLATNYFAASHPSLPNYLALTAGSTFG